MWKRMRFWVLAAMVGMGPATGPNLEIGRLRAAEPDATRQAGQILSQIGLSRGICVLLAPVRPRQTGPAELAVAMARRSDLTIYLQLRSDEAVARVRRQVDAAGMLGTRIYVEKGTGQRIHLADNLADSVVITPEARRMAKTFGKDLRRVL